MSAQQFEHDGFNSAREVEAAKRSAQHTPGPWTLELGDRTCATEVLSLVEGHVRIIADVHSHVLGVDDHADAHLIAAAPDLLTALQETMSAVKTLHGPDAWDLYEQHSPEMKRWRAAIAKATGSAA